MCATRPDVPTFVLLPQVCGLGYYSYSPLRQQYGTESTVKMLLQVAKAWSSCNSARFGIGDMSYVHGGRMEPHASHGKGTTIDIRPLRKDGAETRVDISDDQYDHDATRRLIALFLAHRNTRFVLFNDKKITGVKAYRGHSNHFHVQARR